MPPKRKSATAGSSAGGKQAAVTTAASSGPVAGPAVYLQQRHAQKKQRRQEDKQVRASSKRQAQDSQQRQRGARQAARAPRAFLTQDLPRRLLLGEFVVCVIVVMAGTVVAPSGSNDGATRMMVKLSGLSALFFILALVSSGGPGAAKAAGGLGALVTLTYVVSSSDATNVAKWAQGFFSPEGVGGQRASAQAPPPPAVVVPPTGPTTAQAAV